MSDQAAKQLFTQAQHHKDNGQIQTAITTFHQAHDTYQQAGQLPDEALCLQMIGVCYRLAEQYEQALKFLHSGADQFRQLKSPTDLGNTYRDIAICYFYQKQYQTALNWFNQASELHRSVDNKSALGLTLAKSGLVFLKLHQYDKADLLFKQALTLVREQGDWFAEATILFDWALVGRKKKDYPQMITKLWAALGLICHAQQSDHQQRRLVEIYGSLAYAYLRVDNLNWAVDFFNTALQYLISMPEYVHQPVLQTIKADKFLRKLQKKAPEKYQEIKENKLYTFLFVINN